MKTTKKSILEGYPEMSKQNDLLGLYLYDTQLGRIPNAVKVEKEQDGSKVRVQLYRATGAQGGYVVITNVGFTTRIATLDDANAQMQGRYDEYTLPLRLCLERVTAERNRLCSPESQARQHVELVFGAQAEDDLERARR